MKNSDSVHLYPQPQRFKWLNETGMNELSSNLNLQVQEETASAVERTKLAERLSKAIASKETKEPPHQRTMNVQVKHNADLHPQGYVLQWDGDVLLLEFKRAEGLHYALVAAEQLIFREGIAWRHFRIEDEPDFPVRGLMLDIGRNKIPQMKTLYQLVDRMAEMKLNHLQLYMEGFCFEYEKYKDHFPESTPMTADEFRKLDAYAAARFIDLVPNQNCLGHMGGWLEKPQFRPLAEHPEGMPLPIPFKLPPTTLNPEDEGSIHLVRDMFDELLPHFTSEYANVNMDEPFGLGTGKSKSRADEVGVGRLYLEYAEKVFEIIRSHNKKILMWGDIVTKHPEIIPMLPGDVTVLDWNYESHTSFEAHAKLLQANGVPYYVCPGTSSWSSISGRTDNMLRNISDAAVQGCRHGAEGLIVTDWGDMGHWQVPSISYPGYIYTAGVGWNVQGNLNQENALEEYAAEYVFQDRSGIIGNLLVELGRYYHLEQSTIENATFLNHLLNRGLKNRVELEREMNALMTFFLEIGGTSTSFELDYQVEGMQEWLHKRKEQLAQLDLQVEDAGIVRDELANTLRLIEQGMGIHRYVYRVDLPDSEAETELIAQLKGQLETAILEFKRLWLLRNREGGLEASTTALYNLLEQYEQRLTEAQ
ncbi:family 20 glycosylhydrolase [Paenibacillus donghaensis]|uniref:beta-N-acetylhexosaminidase n=1 Tax=Paenibacillus donghaensis TaxID=414771 RepID=UPI00188458A8|nr:family 20 glycosylhydrolase [Paenibacillus donghaensis]MBE9916140.1 family 20 glycosylhydrolase [Paenibacillus donghaensis]